MLSVILFSLMVWWILWAYTKIQSANIKMANTQEAIQAAESFLERLNDTSIEYMINTGVYGDAEYVVSTWNRKIIKTKSLALINKSHPDDNIKFHRGCIKTWCDCKKSPCTIWMQRQWEQKIDLINNDKITVNNLEFEIYPDQQYVNINITAKNLQWESLYKSGITLSSTIWYKFFRLYPWELTPETLCEDVCSVNQTSNQALQEWFLNMMRLVDNVSMDACTLWYWAGHTETFVSLIILRLEWDKNRTESIFETAYWCINSSDSWCRNYCKSIDTWNPYNCGYIRYQLEHNNFTWNTCSWYNSFVRQYACEDMCVASIFSCLGEEDSLVRRTWIKILSWNEEIVWKYLQNPKSYTVVDENTYKKWFRQWTNWWTWCKNTIWYREYNGFWDNLAAFVWIDPDCEEWLWEKYCKKKSSLWWEIKYQKCIDENSYFYCDGTYYGGWNNTWVIRIKNNEYNYACIKWENKATATQTYSSNRIIYTPETDSTNYWNCICRVNYIYSPYAWWFIEEWTLRWIETIQDNYPYSDSIFKYRQREYDMIYVDQYVSWSRWPLDWAKKWLSLESSLKTNYCKNNELCASNQSYSNQTNYNGKSYNIINTWWLNYVSASINYKLLKCENQEEYNECISTWCCPSPWEIATTYETLLNFTHTSALEYHCTHYHTWINGEFWIRSGNQCHVINETWCITYASWYEYRPIITGVAIGYYCTGILHNVRDWNKCKEDLWYQCLQTDTKTFWWNTAKEYYCPNNYPGYVYSGTTWWCIKCTAEVDNFVNYSISVSDDVKGYYCTNALKKNWRWIWIVFIWDYECCSKPSWSCWTSYTISDADAKAYWCTGNLHYVRDWSNCKQPNGTICTNYDKKQNPSDDDVNKYYCVNNFPWYTWSWWKCTICTNYGVLYSGISINTWTAREKYCTTYLTWLNGINWTHSWDNKCYTYIWDYCANVYTWYETVTSNTTEAREYYCEKKLNWYWEAWNNKCYDKADPQTKCVRFDWYNWNWWTLTDGEYSVYEKYKDCVEKGEGKNIYKDYTYTCDMSITQQSNSILNIIESLWNLAQVITWNVKDWIPRYMRRLF